MNIGKLNRLVTIQSLAEGQDEAGQPVKTWGDMVVVWGDVRYLSGLEVIRADAQTQVGRASIRIRYRTDISPTMQAVVEGKTFQITAVLPDEGGRRHVDLLCEALA